MTVEEAKEYSKTMSYTEAVYNALQGRAVPYKKATKIKLDELLKSANELDVLLDYVTDSINAEKKMMCSCNDLASEDYHKGIIYAFECMKMKLM